VGAPHEKPSLGRYLELPYHIAVRPDRDGERSWWSATVEELPGCSAQGSTPDEAVQLLRPRMEAWLAAALAEDREIPVPSPEASKQKTTPSYSGRFLVRMPSALHEQLASAAERDQVSLNRFVTDVLAASVSPGPLAQRPQPGQEPVPAVEPTPSSQPRPARGIRVALATNLVVVALAGLVAVVLLVLALQRGI
jgi:antitoxin HicB